MGRPSSARTTIGMLAAAGALCGGVAGAVVAGRLSTGDSLPTAVARDEPAAASADGSALRGPTPWPPAGAEVARVRHPHHHHAAAARRKPHRVAVHAAARGHALVRTIAAVPTQQASAPAAGGTGSAPVPVRVPQVSAPVRSPKPASTPVRFPKPATTPTPRAPSPEPAPARSTPKPEPAGSFDDSE